jgi:hypothetical protein
MRRTIVAGLLIVTLATGGCSGGGGSGAGATPQETFDAMKAAAVKKDWGGMVACMTPQTQEMMLGGMAMMVQFMGAMPGGDKFKGAADILTRHGAKLDAKPDMSSLVGGPDAKANPQEALKKVVGDVKDKPACLAEVMAWLEKNGDEKTKSGMNSEQMANSTLTDVKIEGDKATAKITSKIGGKDESQDVHFQKIDGRWYADMSSAMGP